jgi:hypothetical protein
MTGYGYAWHGCKRMPYCWSSLTSACPLGNGVCRRMIIAAGMLQKLLAGQEPGA